MSSKSTDDKMSRRDILDRGEEARKKMQFLMTVFSWNHSGIQLDNNDHTGLFLILADIDKAFSDVLDVCHP